ncbi:phosphoadenylyl-sulfate reductase [Thalassotalea euphylliae]|uniref:Adenosine 5'-phosphosulfate reductase n=1 Tax=Thalassotalea euphylliae TaxID=1655234 RepID=A0A3E0U0R9_9GAMM|nr:phosphoadenylyl-sulfate reductase [Thalassotalea euphylliae]REL30197.1 phosphoadenylyl-sulfate reductase [Thalassotalea euphylliae]
MKGHEQNMVGMSEFKIFLESELKKIEDELWSFRNKKILMTSSFQSQSLPLLHIISRLDVPVDIYVLDTGFLFPETHQFIESVSKELGLNIKTMKGDSSLSDQVVSPGVFLHSQDSDRCCHINKVLPLKRISIGYDVWISGIRADQSSVRAKKKPIEYSEDGLLRYHPMLSWTAKDIYLYRKLYSLPEHPLEKEGYLSVGCYPCTQKYVDSIGSDLRSGRWEGQKKIECGLHTEV